MNTTPSNETKTTIGENDCTNSVEWQTLLSLRGLNPNVRNIQCNLSDDDDNDCGFILELSIDWSNYDLHDEYNPGGEPDEEVLQDIAQYLPKLQVIWDLQRITSLHISNYPFRTLPGGIGNLCTLEHLEIKNCPELIELPSEIGWLSNLKTLRVSQCYKLRSLPPQIGELQQLIQLESDANHELRHVPPDIGRLSNLKVLKISHASDSLTLPTEIGRLQRLEVLILSILSGVQALPIPDDDDDDDDGDEDTETDTDDDGSSDGSSSSSTSNLLPSLQHLQMFGCGGSDEPLNVENIEKMDLQNIKSIRLSKIDSLPLALKEKTPSLESLHLTGVPHDALINFFATEWPEDNSSNLSTLVFTGIRTGSAAGAGKNNDWTLRDDYSQILPGLPTSLSRLDLANQGIDSLDGFLTHPAGTTDNDDDTGGRQLQQLPNGLKTLFLDGNPILKSTNERDRSNLHKLLLANPQLGCIGWDRHLHHLHPENKASKFFDPRYQLFTPTTTHLLLLNRCGRSLLCCGDDHHNSKNNNEDDPNNTNNKSVPLGLWPHVLARVRKSVWNNDGNGNSGVVADRSMEYSVIFSLLQGPALLDRPRT